jgi:TonB family protein
MIAYVLKSSLSLIVLFGLYWFLLRKEKLFVFNRFFLAASVVISLAVPFISIPVSFQFTPPIKEIIPSYNILIPEISTTDVSIAHDFNNSMQLTGKQSPLVDISKILFAVYLSGVLVFLIRFISNIYIINMRIKVSEKLSFKGYRIVLINEATGPCCFLKSIFLNRDDFLNGRIEKELLDHELEHVRQSHTADIILIELVKIFYWFNPVHLLYDRAIRMNHEYLADNGVISNEYDVKSYADKLLGFVTVRGNISLTSGSNHSNTRLRLMMMMKSNSGSKIYGTRIAMTLSMVIVFLLLISFKKSVEQPQETDISDWGTKIAQNIVRGIVMTADGKPLSGATITTTDTSNNTFESLTDFGGRFTIEDVQPGASLLIAYRGFKDQSVKADFTSEIVVRLTRDRDFKGKVFVDEHRYVNFRNPDFTPAKALVVIDGIILDYKDNLKVTPGEMKSFKILADKEATDKYGEKGKDGVVEVLTYGNKTGSARKKQTVSDKTPSDTSRYRTYLSINHASDKGELIDIPLSNLQTAGVSIYHDIDNLNKKESRFIGIMTRDYYKVKGRVVGEDGESLSGVKISASENPATVISDKEGNFVIEDVNEGVLLEFSLPGYITYYLNTLYEVAFNEKLTIELQKDDLREKDDVYTTAETMPQYPGGEGELRKFVTVNVKYPQEAMAQKAKGVVLVRFVVNKKGEIEDVELIHRVHPALDTEVLRVVSKLERFVPGSMGGKPVSVYYTLPVTFSF